VIRIAGNDWQSSRGDSWLYCMLSLLRKAAIRQENFEAILWLWNILVDDKGWQVNFNLVAGMNSEYGRPRWIRFNSKVYWESFLIRVASLDEDCEADDHG
jgi:hypothetical protein